MSVNYVGVKEAADELGVSEASVRRLCQIGEIKGAVKNKTGYMWFIPSPVIRIYPQLKTKVGRPRVGDPYREEPDTEEDKGKVT